jgi:hypothetical protein
MIKRSLKIILVLLAAFGVIAALVFAYLAKNKELVTEAQAEKPVAAKSSLSTGANGELILTLDAQAQERISLQTESLKPATLGPEVKGYGRVLDPTPLAVVVAELATARAEAAASQKEFERLKILNQQQTASERALQAAEATARRDQIAEESARSRLAIGWGSAIADRPDLAEGLRSLVSAASRLVRVDLPPGAKTDSPPNGARLVGLGEENSVLAEYLGPAPNADPQMQGQAFLFLVKASVPWLVPGKSVGALVQFPGEPVAGWMVPDSAVVRHAGQGWIYVKTGENTFTRREIALDHRLENGWFVPKRANVNERVVVSGAQALLSEEQKNQIKLLD